MTGLVQIAVAHDVLARARCGEERARAEIYARLAPATFALIARLAGNRTLAEDLFQETMMSLFEHLGAFRSEAPLGAWVRQIAVTKTLMYLRSPWNRARLRIEPDSEDRLPEDNGMATRLTPMPAPAPESLDLERALASLSTTARAVVWLYDVEGYSHAEIARAFGRSVSFSKSQLARAHGRLRDWFEPDADRQPCTPI